MEFKDHLIQLRKEKGLSQEELGNMLSVTRQTVSKWELGQTTPEMGKLIEMSHLFSISIDELVGNEETWEERGTVRVEKIYVPMETGRHYEYKSKKMIGNIPLVHVNFGTRKNYMAVGIIAAGNIAIGLVSAGLISVGLLSAGMIGFGLLCIGSVVIGGIGIGGVAVGLLAIGGVSIGIVSIGGSALGTYALGGAAVGSKIARGSAAAGTIAIGREVDGKLEFITNAKGMLDAGTREQVKQAILTEYPKTLKIIVDLFTR